MDIQTITRKWGDSIAIIIPNEIIKKHRISANQPINIELKQPSMAHVFGKYPLKEKINVQKIKDELKKGWKDD